MPALRRPKGPTTSAPNARRTSSTSIAMRNSSSTTRIRRPSRDFCTAQSSTVIGGGNAITCQRGTGWSIPPRPSGTPPGSPRRACREGFARASRRRSRDAIGRLSSGTPVSRHTITTSSACSPGTVRQAHLQVRAVLAKGSVLARVGGKLVKCHAQCLRDLGERRRSGPASNTRLP